MQKMIPKNVVFLRQLVGGTCGTIAVVHALANCLNHNENLTDLFPADSILVDLLRDTHAANDDDDEMMSRLCVDHVILSSLNKSKRHIKPPLPQFNTVQILPRIVHDRQRQQQAFDRAVISSPWYIWTECWSSWTVDDPGQFVDD
jgi:Ubiquitin carboxyl-terminal hydrolase, family 1